MATIEVIAPLVIPRRFLPLRAETRNSEGVFYKQFNSVPLTMVEKHFLLGEIDGSHSLLEATGVDLRTGEELRTAKGFAGRYCLKQKTISAWKIKVQHGGILLDGGKGGHLTLLDQISIEAISTVIKTKTKATIGHALSKLPGLLGEEALNTRKRRSGVVFTGEEVDVSTSFVYTTRKKMKIKGRVGQDLTHARLLGVADWRSIYRIACMFSAFSGMIRGEYKWNADATTAIVSKDGTGRLVCWIPTGEERATLNDSTYSASLNVLVKWVHMNNAAGEMGPVTLVLTMPGMKEDDFFAKKVKGITGSPEIGSSGWIYFAKKRCGTGPMWKHWFLNVVIPTLVACRTFHDFKDECDKNMRMIFSTDGEACVLNEVFTPEVLAGFKAALVDYLKNGPSCSSKTQSADVSDNFRDWKTGLDYSTKNPEKCNSYSLTLREALEEAFKELKEKHPHITLESEYKEKVVHVVEKVVWCLRNKYVTAEKIAQGFIRCGQHVATADPKKGESTVDYQKMMNCHLNVGSKLITPAELDHMAEKAPEVMSEFRKPGGQCSDAFLDQLKIAKNPDAPLRDGLTLCRQNCQVITADDTIANNLVTEARAAAAALKKQEAAAEKLRMQDPVYASKKKELEAAKTLLEKQQKSDQQKLDKEAMLQAEAHRVSKLTPTEKKAEKQQRKALLLQQKEATKEKKRRALEEAAQTLAAAGQTVTPLGTDSGDEEVGPGAEGAQGAAQGDEEGEHHDGESDRGAGEREGETSEQEEEEESGRRTTGRLARSRRQARQYDEPDDFAN
mmetsp:Transcript_33448/g.73683  ORF Transcript_33448/g.73683 Transcript_33448/m.73683 type:complete len:787 (-) Transcript_33448:812-3172(-)